MESKLNYQPTRELHYFQQLVITKHYIKYLNKNIDYLEWENEKKDAIIEMNEKEIAGLNELVLHQQRELKKVNDEFRAYVKLHKDFKKDKEKEQKQQALIDELKRKISDLESRAQTRERMLKLMEKQARGSGT